MKVNSGKRRMLQISIVSIIALSGLVGVLMILRSSRSHEIGLTGADIIARRGSPLFVATSTLVGPRDSDSPGRKNQVSFYGIRSPEKMSEYSNTQCDLVYSNNTDVDIVVKEFFVKDQPAGSRQRWAPYYPSADFEVVTLDSKGRVIESRKYVYDYVFISIDPPKK